MSTVTRFDTRIVMLPPEAGSVPKARRLFDEVTRRIGDTPAVFDGRLLLTELIGNCVRHARLTDAQPIEVRIRICRELLRVEVRDEGRGFEPRALRAPPPPMHTGGRGLYLVQALADRWGATSDGATTVWFEIELDGAAQPAGVRSPPAG
jgi:anti-sigma regulatory factor (Ser/Thr protein kinase)